MDVVKSFSRRSFFTIVILSGILFAAIDATIYYSLQLSSEQLPLLTESQAGQSRTIVDQFIWALGRIDQYYLPISAGVFVVFVLVLWLLVRGSHKKALRRAGMLQAEPAKKIPAEETEPVGKRERSQHDRRLFLHLLSVLQREGRLVDFFYEDLEGYEDGQIGAAVRSIHENCRRVIEKYLTPKSVLEDNEGEEVSISTGFDSGAVKMTGNVTGEPPFRGIVRHRGWRAGKVELPTLSSSQDPNIIAPAEVEMD